MALLCGGGEVYLFAIDDTIRWLEAGHRCGTDVLLYDFFLPVEVYVFECVHLAAVVQAGAVLAG